MDHFPYRNGQLYAEEVGLTTIAAEYGTPTYVYSRRAIEANYRAIVAPLSAVDHLICYAVKANANLAILNLLSRLGAGFDIVSVGELERVIAAGGDATRVVFSGVGKRRDEMARALEVGIHCFNIESEAELERLNDVAAAHGVTAPISLRVNPDVDAQTHPYISTGLKENKFGIAIDRAFAVYQRAATLPHLKVVGIDCHIGSQLTQLTPFVDALDRVLLLVDRLQQSGISLHHIDMGGGLGITYRNERPPAASDWVSALLDRLGDRRLQLILEPGRSIVGNAGVLLTRVEYLKRGDRDFAIVDAAMNDLMRPALYNSWMEIVAVTPHDSGENGVWDIVGPICETGDFLGKERQLVLREGDLLAIRAAGAYGASMSSNYNTRPRAAEVMVAGDKCHLIRQREPLSATWALEQRIPE
jgi:diaminopimelate decarboxylase